ncbi:MAG: glycosyltransferase, partial [Chloroflexi bacterium]|nr:glycosyltransferase [Chloroflexota bacterium]
MKVLQITGEYPPMRGGIADYTQGLTLALAAEGVTSSVLTSSAAEGQTNPQNSSEEVLPWVEQWNWGLSGTARSAAEQTGAALAHLQYQTGAFAMHPAVNALPWLLARRGLPVVATMHDLRTPYLFPKAGPLRSCANRFMMRTSAAVITTNPQDFAQAQQQAGGTPVYLVPLANQVPASPPPGYDRAEFRRRRGWDGRFVVAHFGMINHTKGAESLVQAAALLRDRGEP